MTRKVKNWSRADEIRTALIREGDRDKGW